MTGKDLHAWLSVQSDGVLARPVYLRDPEGRWEEAAAVSTNEDAILIEEHPDGRRVSVDEHRRRTGQGACDLSGGVVLP